MYLFELIAEFLLWVLYNIFLNGIFKIFKKIKRLMSNFFKTSSE